AAAGWTKCLGPRVCETGRVYLLRDRAQVGTHSHPGRVLLRVRGGRFWFCAVGAPPPVRTADAAGTDLRPGQAPFAPGAGAPTGSLAGFGFVVGAPPWCEPRTKRAQICAPGRPHSHPGRVLLRVRVRFWFFAVGAPPRCEPRTWRAWISAPGRPHSHPGRVLLRFAGGFGFLLGAPPPVRTANAAGTDQPPGQAPIRTRGGCSFGSTAVLVLCCMSTAPVGTA